MTPAALLKAFESIPLLTSWDVFDFGYGYVLAQKSWATIYLSTGKTTLTHDTQLG